MRAWFEAPLAIEAPFNDFLFLKSLLEYKKIDEKISCAVVKKFVGHLWYLSPEVISFSFFNSRVPVDLKRKMRAKIVEDIERAENAINPQKDASDICDEKEESDESETTKRVVIKPTAAQNLIDDGFEKLIPETKMVLTMFNTLNMNYHFLKDNPSLWWENPVYQDCVMHLKNLRVVNDVAERGVKLISDYNNAVTTEENQKQYLLQVVAQFRREFPNADKSTLLTKV